MYIELVTSTIVNRQSQTSSEKYEFRSDDGTENCVVNLHPSIQYQFFEGFGGAITEASGYVYSQMDADSRRELLELYFSPSTMNYRHVRIPLDSCDFSLGHYEAVSDPDDTTFSSFDLSRVEKYIFPMINDARKVAGKDLEIMLSPWSPPAYMKTNNDRNHGGSLRSDYQTIWADYICRYIIEFQKRGYLVRRISVQNEPKAAQIWDSCVYSAIEERQFLTDALYPALARKGLTDIEVFIWDHNKERVLERAQTIIDNDTDILVSGIAFHWYSGDHFEELDLFRESYPDKLLISSESCVEYSKYDSQEPNINAERLAHDMIGNLNHGMNAFYDWNILLDEKGGPNHVNNFCEAPIMYDIPNKNIIQQISYLYYSHFCKYIQNDARRIAFSRYTEHLEMTAFKNPDGTLTGVFLNRTESSLPVVLRVNGLMASVMIKPRSISSFIIEKLV